MSARAINATGERFSLFKVHFVDAARLQLIYLNDLNESVHVADHSILTLLWRRRNEADRAQSVLRERVDEVEHARRKKLHVARVLSNAGQENVRVLVVSENVDLVQVR